MERVIIETSRDPRLRARYEPRCISDIDRVDAAAEITDLPTGLGEVAQGREAQHVRR